MNRLTFALGFLWLACAAHAAGKLEKKPDYAYEPKSGQGTVMLRVISNRNIATARWWNGFAVQRKGALSSTGIGRLRGFDGGDSYFIQSLPPGEYTALQLGTSGYEYGMLKDFWVTFDPSGAWTFKVEAGRMTNLGTIIHLMPQGREVEDRYRWVHFPDPNLPQRSAYFFNPDDYPQLLSSQLGWTSIPSDVAASTLRSWERQLSLKLGGGAPAADGGRLFGEIMGQVAWRRADGSWAWEDTGTIESIAMAAETADGVRYAFGHSSQMLRKFGPNDWRRVTVPFDGAEPCYVEAQPQGGLLTVWDRDESIAVLRYQHGADPEWQTVHEFQTPEGFFDFSDGCQAVSNGRKMVVIRTYYTSKRRLQFLDLATGETSDLKFNNSESFDMLPDGMIYAMHGGEAKRKLRVTRDLGKSWEQYEANYFLKALYRTADEGVALRSFGLHGQDGKANSNRSLWGTRDGGRTWQPLTGLPSDTNNMIALPGKAILFTTSTGVLFSWSGEGDSARRERVAAR